MVQRGNVHGMYLIHRFPIFNPVNGQAQLALHLTAMTFDRLLDEFVPDYCNAVGSVVGATLIRGLFMLGFGTYFFEGDFFRIFSGVINVQGLALDRGFGRMGV